MERSSVTGIISTLVALSLLLVIDIRYSCSCIDYSLSQFVR